MSKQESYKGYAISLDFCDGLWYFSVSGEVAVRRIDRGLAQYKDAIKNAKRLVDDMIKHPHAYGYH